MKEQESKKQKNANRKRSASPFSRNLKRIMSERNLSIRATAEICEVSPSMISDWINGAVPADPMITLKLSKVLCVNFQWLLTGTNAEEERQFSLTEVFDEQDTGFNGIFRIEARKLIKRG